jgi:hypothetical protein
MQLLSRNTDYVRVAYALCGENINETAYYYPAQADVVVVRNSVVGSD